MVTAVAAPDPAHDGVSCADADSLSLRARGRLAYSLAAKRASEYARAQVPTTGDRHLQPGELMVTARRLVNYAHAVRDAAVLAELSRGTTWEQLAASAGRTVEDMHAEHDDRVAMWLEGRPAPSGPVLADGSRPALSPPPADPRVGLPEAYALDSWVLRTADPLDPAYVDAAQVTRRHPVSAHLDVEPSRY